MLAEDDYTGLEGPLREAAQRRPADWQARLGKVVWARQNGKSPYWPAYVYDLRMSCSIIADNRAINKPGNIDKGKYIVYFFGFEPNPPRVEYESTNTYCFVVGGNLLEWDKGDEATIAKAHAAKYARAFEAGLAAAKETALQPPIQRLAWREATHQQKKAQNYSAGVEYDEDLSCVTCGKEDGTDANPILICEQCEQGWHLRCIKLGHIPEDEWFCDTCAPVPKAGCAPAGSLLPAQMGADLASSDSELSNSSDSDSNSESDSGGDGAAVLAKAKAKTAPTASRKRAAPKAAATTTAAAGGGGGGGSKTSSKAAAKGAGADGAPAKKKKKADCAMTALASKALRPQSVSAATAAAAASTPPPAVPKNPPEQVKARMNALLGASGLRREQKADTGAWVFRRTALLNVPQALQHLSALRSLLVTRDLYTRGLRVLLSELSKESFFNDELRAGASTTFKILNQKYPPPPPPPRASGIAAGTAGAAAGSGSGGAVSSAPLIRSGSNVSTGSNASVISTATGGSSVTVLSSVAAGSTASVAGASSGSGSGIGGAGGLASLTKKKAPTLIKPLVADNASSSHAHASTAPSSSSASGASTPVAELTWEQDEWDWTALPEEISCSSIRTTNTRWLFSYALKNMAAAVRLERAVWNAHAAENVEDGKAYGFSSHVNAHNPVSMHNCNFNDCYTEYTRRCCLLGNDLGSAKEGLRALIPRVVDPAHKTPLDVNALARHNPLKLRALLA